MTRDEFIRWATRFPDALMLVAGDGRILACNPAASRFVSSDEVPLVGRTLFEFAPSSAESVRNALRLWSGTGQMVYGPAAFNVGSEGKFLCEGAVIAPRTPTAPATLLVRLKRHEAAAEKFLSLNGTIEKLSTEVHARKRSEELIRQQREWLHVTLSSIGDAVIATDVHGKIEFMNHAAERLTGWMIPEAQGRSMIDIFDIFHEGTGEPVENPVARVVHSGKIVDLANHTVLRARNGTRHPIEDSAAPIRDSKGILVGVVLVFRDIGEKKKAQTALMESERRFRLWIDLNVIAAGVSDLVETFLDGNDALLELLGYTRAELIAGQIKWRDLTPPEYLVRDEQAIAEARTRGGCQPYEKEYVHRNGRRVPVIIGYALFTSPGRYPHQRSDELAICFIVDISERKRTEEFLEKRVEERTARLKDAVSELEAFSYTISHDLRAPLRSMQAYSRLLLEDYGSSLDDDGKGFLQKIVRSGEHLDTLIKDVLAQARISKTRHTLEAINLGVLLAELVERYPDFSNPRVKIEIASDIPTVMGNDALLTQCFANLVGNAIKFVAAGTMPHVRIYGERKQDRVRLWIHDNGIGVAAADAERIFGVFERIHPAGQYDGTGIGLSVVRKAAEKMGGSVGLESELGVGSRFWIDLAAG